jgi:hypothetical protein
MRTQADCGRDNADHVLDFPSRRKEVRRDESSLCTHFQLVLLARPDGGDQRAGEESLGDARVHMIAREDLLDFVHALDREELVAAVVDDG